MSVRRPGLQLRSGFTLVELLVVIAIIGILAGLLIPGTSLMIHRAKTTQDMNNLQGIGRAILAYRVNWNIITDDRFPPYLGTLVSRHGLIDDIDRRVFVSPFDPHEGRQGSGRASHHDTDWANLEYLYDRERDNTEHPIDISYLYEVSGARFCRTGNEQPDETEALRWFGEMDPPTQGLDGIWPDTYTWADYKRWQQANGNFQNDAQTEGAPWPKPRFPILRNYHHYPWNGHPREDNEQKVLNLGWDCRNIFWSSPRWEVDENEFIR